LNKIINTARKQPAMALFTDSSIKYKIAISFDLIEENVDLGHYRDAFGLIDDIELMVNSYISLCAPSANNFERIAEFGNQVRKASNSACGKCILLQS
jgi:hypothetical protein